MNSLRTVALSVLIPVVVAACGGGGGGPSLVDGGIGGSGFSAGPISGFGSIIVNGVRFDIAQATVTSDGVSGVAAQNLLDLGDFVVVQGSINSDGATGTATSVTFENNVEGPVDSIDAANDSLVVMGQTVRIDGKTVFDGFGALADLNPGADVVEVSGFFDLVTGEVLATRIELKGGFVAGVTEVEVRGTVSAFNGTDRFNIGALVVQFSGATQVEGVIADGNVVKAEGTVNAGVLTATEIEQKDANPVADADEGDEVEVEGTIHDFNGVADFRVNGVPVDAQNATFEGGSAASLADGRKVEVEGQINAAGVLVADEVEISADDIRVDANVQGVGASSLTFSLGAAPDTLTVTVNAGTQLKDNTGTFTPFALTDIMAGDRVRVRAFQEGGSVTASLVELEELGGNLNEQKLRGPVDSAADPLVTVLGITIDTTGFADNNDFRDDDGNGITRAAFFAAAVPGATAEAKDQGADGVFEEIALED